MGRPELDLISEGHHSLHRVPHGLSARGGLDSEIGASDIADEQRIPRQQEAKPTTLAVKDCASHEKVSTNRTTMTHSRAVVVPTPTTLYIS